MRPPYRSTRAVPVLVCLLALLGLAAPASAVLTYLPSLVIPNPNPQREGRFGWAFAANGTTLLVGAPGRFDTAVDDGRAYLIDGLTGAVLRTFASPDPGGGDNFGAAVAMADGVCLVSGQRFNGSVARGYLFDCASGALLHRLEAPAGTVSFGHAVALAGGDALVSDPNDVAPAIGSGAVHRYDGATGNLVATYYPPESPRGIGFGTTLAVSPTRFAVGAPFVGAPNAKGTVYVYDIASGGSVFNLRNPTPPAGAIGPDFDLFGGSIRFRGEDIVIGDPDDNFGEQNAGGVYIFSGFNGDLLQTVRSPTLQPFGRFGAGLALDGSTLLVAAPGEARLAQTGTVHFFAPNGTPTNAGAIGPYSPGDGLERHLAPIDRGVAVAAPFYGEQPLQFSGAVIVYAPCQDGQLDVGEECDDGNSNRCDGCDSTCHLEPGWQCGDGVISTTCDEICDDGPGNSDTAPDACRTDCTLPACGDGTTDSVEECDDGGHSACDGCGPTCHIELGLVCGDGITQPACDEECDDANLLRGDGCTDACSLEFIPGGGGASSDCTAGWTVDNPTNVPEVDKHGDFSNRQACVDGDPLCDFDAGIPNSCTFHVRACANATGMATCDAPTRLRSWELTKPSVNQAARRPVFAALRAALAGVIPVIVGPSTRNFCTDPIALVVPTTGAAAAPLPGKVVLGSRASTYDGRRDSDKLLLTCVPD